MPTQEVEHIQKGDSGTVLYLVVWDEDDDPVNISTATTLQIKIKQPVSGDVDVHDATIHDGPAGIMKYTLLAADTDEVGLCTAQGYVVTPTWTGHTNLGYYYVEDNLS